MKKSIVGTLALAAMVIGFSAFKSADAKVSTVAADSAAAYVADTAAMVADIAAMVDTAAIIDTAAIKGADTAAVNLTLAQDSLKNDTAAAVAEAGTITGKIVPADGASEVEAVNGDEKLKGAVSNGAFTIPAAKSGNYTVTILGKSPYKNAVIKDVKVEEGKATDLGEIKLEQ